MPDTPAKLTALAQAAIERISSTPGSRAWASCIRATLVRAHTAAALAAGAGEFDRAALKANIDGELRAFDDFAVALPTMDVAVVAAQLQTYIDAVGETYDDAIKVASARPFDTPLQRALARALAQQEAASIAAILAGDDPTIDSAALRQALTTSLIEVFTAAIAKQADALNIPIEEARAAALAHQWAASYVPDMTLGLTETTRTALQNVIAAYRATPGMTRADVARALAGTFGKRRAKTIASTEITRAMSQATRAYNGYLREYGLDYEFVWRTNKDEHVCPICSPLNGTVVGADALPPAHTSCRCVVTQRLRRVQSED